MNDQTGEELEIIGAADTAGSTSIDQGITIRNLTSSLQTVTATWDLASAGGPYGLGYVNSGETIHAPTDFSVPYSFAASVGSDPAGNSNTPFSFALMIASVFGWTGLRRIGVVTQGFLR